MKKLILFLLIVTSFVASAQSPFKRLQHPKNYSLQQSATPETIYAFRFTGPMAGYMYPQDQVITGLGYGYQKLHWVDSTQRYYTDFSISAVLYAGGNVTPTLTPNNVISVGLSLGFLNQLIMIGPCYNLPRDGNGGSFGVVVNLAVPLN